MIIWICIQKISFQKQPCVLILVLVHSKTMLPLLLLTLTRVTQWTFCNIKMYQNTILWGCASDNFNLFTHPHLRSIFLPSLISDLPRFTKQCSHNHQHSVCALVICDDNCGSFTILPRVVKEGGGHNSYKWVL